MSNDRTHFKIPKENIRNEKYEKTGGGKTFQRFNHTEHGRKLKEQTLKLKQIEFSKKDAEYTSDLFFQIETPKDIPIKGEKLRLKNLGFDLINYSKENKSIGVAKINKEQLGDFENRLREYIETPEHIGKSYFSVVEDIASVPTESKIKTEINFDSDEKVPIVINLYNVLATKERLAINSSIINEIKKYTKEVEQRTFNNGVTSIACVLKAKEIPLIAEEFTTIREIKPNYITFVENSVPADKMPNPLKIGNPISDSAICIFDSGINSRNGVFDKLIYDRVIKHPPTAIDSHYEHGTFVASRCTFGDNIDSCLGTHTLNPYCKLLDVPVFGIDAKGNFISATEFHLRSSIEDVVLQYHGVIKVYNLSLGSNIPIKNFEFSELAKLLDHLSKTYKVLFVISSGNINALLGDFPIDHFSSEGSRIGVPAESLLSLTVGAIAKHKDVNALAEINEISPFSRIGPGSDLGIKPELVAHGGNLIQPYNYSPRVSTYGITSDGKNLAVDNGTSFAAPLISQYAQKLFDQYPNSDPNLVKALLCHFSDQRNVYDEITDDIIKFTGFGEPNIDKALSAGNFNAAYIYEGQLNQDEYQYVSFDVPDSLASSGKSKLKVKVTITYDPPVNADNEAEYSSARISASLNKSTDAGMKAALIDADDKYLLPWNPIIQFEKIFNRSYLTGRWELRMRLYTRGKVDETYLQDYAAVIEIIDENSSTNVFNDILKQFSKIYEQIKLKFAA